MTNTQEKFWKKVDTSSGQDACWIWRGALGSGGYGQVHFKHPEYKLKKGTKWKTHRLAFLFTHGTLFESICHKCDTPACCNPAHLWGGTHAENMRDRDEKGRHKPLRGEENGSSRFTEKDILAIRRKFEEGMTQTAIANEFGVKPGHIHLVIRKKIWRHI